MKKDLLIARLLLTLGVLEFFGPLIKDTGASHLLNHEWTGHAKVHLAWLLGYMFFSGLANIYFIWMRKPFHLNNLYLSALWQGCHLAGFWAAIALVPTYGGAIIEPPHHTTVMGIDENIFGFAILTVALVAAILFIKYKLAPHYEQELSISAS